MSTTPDYTYQYLIVEFISRGRKKKVKDIDAVPSNCMYLQPPYDDEDLILLNNLIENRTAPPEDWPVYSVIFKGQASTFLLYYV